MNKKQLLAAFASGVLMASCATGGGGSGVVDVAPGSKAPAAGVGIEGRDIVSMTNTMARDIVANKRVVGDGKTPPRVIIDAQYFRIEGSQPMNRNLISQRLLVELNRAAAGRLVFVGRRHAGMVADERDLKRDGVTDQASGRMTKAQMGADYRLAGSFSTMDQVQTNTGRQQRYNQLVFELVDLESGEIVWTGLYEVERSATDDVVYR